MWLSDLRAIFIRNVIRHVRTPEVFVFGVLQPIMFVLLFSKVFGGAIQVPGTNYTNYLMAGIFAQSVIFGATFSGYSVALDSKEGFMDRLKTLPMARWTIIAARTLSDLLINIVSLITMVLTGLAAGWRPQAGLWNFLAGLGLLLLFAWAFSWVMILLGLAVPNPEALNSASFMVLFPLTFISNGFVPADSLPGPLRTFANFNPVSAFVQATRNLFGNNGEIPVADVWTMQHPITFVMIASVILVAVSGPLAVKVISKTE